MFIVDYMLFVIKNIFYIIRVSSILPNSYLKYHHPAYHIVNYFAKIFNNFLNKFTPILSYLGNSWTLTCDG